MTNFVDFGRFLRRTETLSSQMAFLFALILCLFSFSPLSALEYSVTFSEISNSKVLKKLKEASNLVTLRSSPPATMSSLHRRAAEDTQIMMQVLRSLGYYDAIVSYDVEEKPRISLVRLNIQTGPVYKIADILLLTVAVHPNAEALISDSPVAPDPFLNLGDIPIEPLGIKEGAPAEGKKIKIAEKRVYEQLALLGYPLAEVVDSKFVADQSAKTMTITWWVNSGPQVSFGPTTVTGLQTIHRRFVDKKITWDENDIFDPKKVQSTRKNLEKTRLFSTVEITHADIPKEGNQLPMTLTLVERKHRSIALGVSYNTDLGPGVSAEWEHRNIQGTGHRLTLKTEIEDRDQLGEATYRIPDFHRIDQDLLISARLRGQKTENFKEKTAAFGAHLERKASEQLKVAIGGELKHIRTENSDNNRTRTLISAPFSARWNTADDPLNPTEGWLLNVFVTPHTAIPAADLSYVKILTQVASYYRLTSDDTAVLAGKVTLGSIAGASQTNIPPSERFYAGSESLLRGYQRLTVSPLDPRNKPIGGRSLLVTNLELRLRTGEDIGWVLFYEAGNVYANPLPKLNHSVLQSAGVGFRYHTPVGPIRIDLAFPMNPRRGLDDKWELYLNIGQSF